MKATKQWYSSAFLFRTLTPLIVGALIGSVVYYVSYQNKKALQQSNLNENIRLIETQLSSFDLAGLENLAKVFFQADYITGISIRTRNGYLLFDRHKNNSGEKHDFVFTELRPQGGEKHIGTAQLWINHDQNSIANLVLFMFSGGSLGLFFVWPFFYAGNLKRQLEERTASELAIIEREENLRITLDSIADAVIVTNTNGLISRMNPVAEQLTGWRFSEAKNQPLNLVYHVINRQTGVPLENPAEAVIKSGSPVDLQEDRVLINRQNKEYRVAESAAPIIQLNDQISGVVIVFRDVTEERLTQRKIREMEKMQAIGELVGGLAHDYNNLLGIISGAAEVIAIEDKQKLSLSSQSLLTTIVKTSKRGADLTARLLAFSSGSSIDRETFSVHQSIDNVVEIMRQIINKRFELIMNLNAKEYHVMGNQSMMENALLNMALNASQAMKGDSGKLEISTQSLELTAHDPPVKIFHAPAGKCIKIALRDDGVGIPENVIGRIFEPFFSGRKDSGGTGLGLSAVYATVVDHGGTIVVDSEVGAGTAFTLFLPVSEKVEHATEQPASPIQHSNKTVLVVDDEEGIRQTLSKMLNLIGYNVLLAAGGAEAIGLYEEKHQEIDGIIMDMNMPEMTGHEAISKIWQIDETCPVVISTGHAETPGFSINDLKAHYNISFIRKPYSLFALSTALTDCFQSGANKA